jgi:hypothetical protein
MMQAHVWMVITPSGLEHAWKAGQVEDKPLQVAVSGPARCGYFPKVGNVMGLTGKECPRCRKRIDRARVY